jgi:site-specific recombinase XerD
MADQSLPTVRQPSSPEFDLLRQSWQLSLRADAYSERTVSAYTLGLRTLVDWLAEQGAEVEPAEVTRDHVRGWIVALRADHKPATVRVWVAGVRHFFRFLLAEGEITTDPTSGIRAPAQSETSTPTLSADELRRLLKVCEGTDFVSRRDMAVIRVFLDTGLRLSELAGLQVDDVDLDARMLFVAGKATQRRGAKPRACPIGLKTAQALDRYLRERRHHVGASLPALWLGVGRASALSKDAVAAVVERRAAMAGIEGMHPHTFRHSWAHNFRANGGSEGDLMVLGGWRSRVMLDRYGASAAAERAAESARRLSLGDRL